MTRFSFSNEKKFFKTRFQSYVKDLELFVNTERNDWSVKGFVDSYKHLYKITSDTKLVSKVMEIQLLQRLLEFGESIQYRIELPFHQNYYPDFTFISNVEDNVKFAVDLKTTYRSPKYGDHINGFTLGSYKGYFRNRNSSKNIQYPYSEYLGHFCLGVIYTRNTISKEINQTNIDSLDDLQNVKSVIKDLEMFFCEKWEIASDRVGSGNTANIGSITDINDVKNAQGMFINLGEEWFDEYWMNYNTSFRFVNKVSKPIRSLKDFVEFKGGTKLTINPMRPKSAKES